MSFRFPQPSNEDDFELFCLRFLRELWQCPTLQQYGKRGERQNGIDLIDEGGSIPLRAVQCKHHEPDKTIPPAEIKDEVTKALGSGIDLGEYYIITTARKTTISQKAIIETNQDHTKRGKFRVSLWTWAEIEAQLSSMDDGVKDRVLYGDTGRSAPVLVKALTGVLAAHFDSHVYSSESALDGELDDAKAAVDTHKPEVASHALDKIESRHGTKLSDSQWYRLKVMRANLLIFRGEWVKAGTTLLDAKRHQPDSERAKVNEALAYELLGDKTKAHQIAATLRAEYPHSARPVAIWLRTAPEAMAYTDLEAVAAPLAFDEEVHLALSHRGLIANRLDKAVEQSTFVIRQNANSPQGHFQLGLAYHQQGRGIGGHDRALRLGEAEKEYDKTIELCRLQTLGDLEAAALVNRGILRGLLDDPRAEADLAVAADRSSKPEFRLHYAGFLLDRNRCVDALREILHTGGQGGEEARFLEAAARHGRNEGNDRSRAKQILVELITAGPGERWLDAHVLFAQFAVDGKSPQEAEAVIRPSALGNHNPLAYHAILGWLAHEGGDSVTADQEVAKASLAVKPDSAINLLRLLTQLQTTRGNDEAALPILERCARPGVFDADGRRLLDCAIRLGRHDVVQRICRELRLAGETDPRLIRAEIQVLQLYDVGAAFRVAEEYHTAHPDNKYVTLWRSHLALRLERPELVVTDLTRLPAVSEVDTREGQLVIATLRAKGEYAAALDYSYKLLREHFNEEEANGQYLGYFHLLSPRVPQLQLTGAVAIGSAVCYREAEDGPMHWVVIEPDSNPDPGRNEYPPDHHLAKAFLGKSVDDVIVLSTGAVQDRTATVLAVLHRYVYRFQATMREFQVVFPDSSVCQMVRVMTGELFDPTPFIKSLEDRRKHINQLDDLYRTQPLPLHTYACWGGSDEMAAWEHLTASSHLGIRCCSGRREEFREATELIRNSKTLVLDATALHTLARLQMLLVLGSPGWTFVVSQATYDYYRDLAESGQVDERERGTMMLRDGRLTIVENAPQYQEEYAAFLCSIPEAVRAHCQVRPCPAAASLSPKKRSQLDEVLGRGNLESMMLSAEEGSVLWTDDHIVGLIARSDFSAQRAWTQVALFEFLQQQVVLPTAFEQASARLVGWHYNGTQISAATLIAAAEVAEWHCTRWPVCEVLKSLGNPEVSVVSRLSMAASAIKTVWQRADTESVRPGFLFAVLSGIRSIRLVQRLLMHTPDLFGVDVFSGDEVANYIRYWLHNPPPTIYTDI